MDSRQHPRYRRHDCHRVTLEAYGPRVISDLLVFSHAAIRDDFEISAPELDLALEMVLTSAALVSSSG